jgi:hypothetical protein
MIPYERYVRLKRVCIRANYSNYYSDYVRASGSIKCIILSPLFTNTE